MVFPPAPLSCVRCWRSLICCATAPIWLPVAPRPSSCATRCSWQWAPLVWWCSPSSCRWEGGKAAGQGVESAGRGCGQVQRALRGGVLHPPALHDGLSDGDEQRRRRLGMYPCTNNDWLLYLECQPSTSLTGWGLHHRVRPCEGPAPAAHPHQHPLHSPSLTPYPHPSPHSLVPSSPSLPVCEACSCSAPTCLTLPLPVP